MCSKSAAESRIFVKFDHDGSFGGAYIDGVNLDIKHISSLSPEYEEVSYDEYQMLIGNSGENLYIRDPKTKEYIIKPSAPTIEEKLALLDTDYEFKFSEINDAILLAFIENDVDLQAELVKEKAVLKIEYEQKRSEL